MGLFLEGNMRASQNHLPQSFEASHRPQQPQYFLVVMSGRRNSYVELDSDKKSKILAPYCNTIDPDCFKMFLQGQ